MSQSLADLFAAGSAQRKRQKEDIEDGDSMQQDTSYSYPAVESISDVIPPDPGKPLNETSFSGRFNSR